MKAFWLQHKRKIILGAVGIILLLVLLRRCDRPDPVVKNSAADSLKVELVNAKEEMWATVNKKNREIDSIVTEQRKAAREASLAKTEIRRLIAKGSGIIAVAPPAVKDERNYDSLATAFYELGEVTNQYITEIEVMTEQNQILFAKKDSIILTQGKLLFDFQNKLIASDARYVDLSAKYATLARKYKRNQGWTKVLAGIAGAGIIVASMK